jgi:hypothetical protein
MLPMSHHAGPSNIRPANQARKPRRGRKGKTEPVNPGADQPRDHEVKAKRPARKRGFGKIKSTGKPRFTHFDKRTKF